MRSSTQHLVLSVGRRWELTQEAARGAQESCATAQLLTKYSKHHGVMLGIPSTVQQASLVKLRCSCLLLAQFVVGRLGSSIGSNLRPCLGVGSTLILTLLKRQELTSQMRYTRAFTSGCGRHGMRNSAERGAKKGGGLRGKEGENLRGRKQINQYSIPHAAPSMQQSDQRYDMKGQHQTNEKQQ